jgi:hypothetical protein
VAGFHEYGDKPWVCIEAGNFLTSQASFNFSRQILHIGVTLFNALNSEVTITVLCA